MTRFTGKVVLVTGAASGIGAATARRFSEEGAAVVMVDREEATLRATAASFPAERTMTVAADVADLVAVERFVREAVGRFRRLDVLVNNAGVVAKGTVTEASVEDWRRVMAVDVDAVFYCTRAAVPHLIGSKGCIVNVSSVSGLGGDWGMSFYNAAKGAVTNFTRALAMDLGADGVRVNAVNPTLTWTGLTAGMEKDEALMAKFRERIPLGRPGEPEEVAAVIAFLASEDARFVTGINLPVDGGLGASNGQPRQA
jgi:meso-butanediol dehydrogenase / (S,S)-butanediol dehydrogenase / diacetyl reductase